MISDKTIRFLRNVIFSFRMTRAKSLIAGPHTYTFVLLRNLVVQRPAQEWVLLAYVIGVCLMEVAHRFLIHHRKIQLDSRGGRAVVTAASSSALVHGKTAASSSALVHEKASALVHEKASAWTNAAYLCISTVQLLHVTGLQQTFLVVFVMVTIRIQQTLSGGKRAALFSGPLIMIAVTSLCAAALLWREHQFTLPVPVSPYANADGPSATAVLLLCAAVGASAHAHLQWVVLHEHNDAIYMWDKQLVQGVTFVSHLLLACVSGFVAAYHPIMVDIQMVVSNPDVGILLPRLTLTIIVLLLCTAPICDSCVFQTLLGDGSVIITTVIITQAYPAMGSVVLIAISVSISIMAFVFVYIRCDEWQWRRWAARLVPNYKLV